jgi:hypothetical protein
MCVHARRQCVAFLAAAQHCVMMNPRFIWLTVQQFMYTASREGQMYYLLYTYRIEEGGRRTRQSS